MDVVRKNEFPSPYSGILFLSGCIPKKPKWAKYVSVPSFGDSFFISCCVFIHSMAFILVSVPSFGDSFFIINRPLRYTLTVYLFPSPHSGILFLSYKVDDVYYLVDVSVPSFGDSFFIAMTVSHRVNGVL